MLFIENKIEKNRQILYKLQTTLRLTNINVLNKVIKEVYQVATVIQEIIKKTYQVATIIQEIVKETYWVVVVTQESYNRKKVDEFRAFTVGVV